jgi:hypothetical protein
MCLLEVESSTVLIPASVRELPGSPLVTVDMGKPLSNLDVVGAAGGARPRVGVLGRGGLMVC